MNNEIKRYEDAYEDLVESIKLKRMRYYEEYEIDPPSKEKSL